MGVKISDLEQADTPLDADEEFEVTQDGVSKRTTVTKVNDKTTKSQVGLGNVLNKAQLARDGSETATGNLPMGGNKVTGLGSPSAAGEALRHDELAANGGTVPETDRANTFSADQTVNATLNATTLQENGQRVGPIESGTWTPVLKGETTPGDFTYSRQNGVYTQLGKIVYAPFRVQISSINSAPAGALRLEGLPLTVSDASDIVPNIGFSIFKGGTEPSDFKYPMGLVFSTDIIALRYIGASLSETDFPSENMGASFQMAGTIIYRSL